MPERDIRVDSFHVRTDIKSRFATTVITSRMTNVTGLAKEVSFTSKLPEAAFITDFTMQIGEKIVHGEVKEKQAAKQAYDDAKSKGQTAGHVFQKQRETDIFTISTNVGPNTEVIFTLTYQEILQRVHGVYKHIVNMDLEQLQPMSDVQIEVEILERGKINKVHVPKVGPKIGEKTNADLLKWEAEPKCTIKSSDDSSISTANVSYRISASDLMEHQKEGGQFVLLYDLDRAVTGGQVQVVNGYFVHFFAPEGLEVIGKHVIFVLDKSGSMRGRKMQQTKDAMRRILRDLRKEDMFNVVWFSSGSQVWKPESVAATSDNVMKAISDVERMQTGGSTNVHDAIMDGLGLLSKSESEPLASMIVFMTDGRANKGPVHEANALVDAITSRNESTKFIIHTLAFGNDADLRMLQRIAARNNGLACKIYEDLDADVQLIGFYQQISSPLLSDVNIEYVEGPVDLKSLVYDHTSTYYSGSEMMVLGRLKNLDDQPPDQPDQPRVEAKIKCCGRRGQMELISRCIPMRLLRPNIEKRLTSGADTDAGKFVERMWAYQTIKKLLKESQLSYCTSAEKEAKRKEALNLSLKYRFVTELTSMVVVEADFKKVEASEPGSGKKGGGSKKMKKSKSRKGRSVSAKPSPSPDKSRSKSQPAQAPPAKVLRPISYVIMVIKRADTSIDSSITSQITQWIQLLCAYFHRLFQSTPEQPYIVHVISVNPATGKAYEAATLKNSVPDFQDQLSKTIADTFSKDQGNSSSTIEELISRNEDVVGKKQVWFDVENRSVATGPLSEVFNYLDKVAHYEYIGKTDLEEIA